MTERRGAEPRYGMVDASAAGLPDAGMTDADIATHLEAVAQVSAADVLDTDDGGGLRLKPNLPRAAMMAIKPFKVDAAGRIKDIQFHSKLAALKLLMETRGLARPAGNTGAAPRIDINLHGDLGGGSKDEEDAPEEYVVE